MGLPGVRVRLILRPVVKKLPLVLAVFVLTGAVYLNSIGNDFNLDDTAIIRDNPLVQHLSNLPRILKSNYWANTPYADTVLLYRPLPVASFACEYALWGSRPAGYHVINLLLNAAVAALLFLLLVRLFAHQVPLVGLAVAALGFGWHPVHTEAVNLVVGRTELLAAFFGLLTLLCHLNSTAPPVRPPPTPPNPAATPVIRPAAASALWSTAGYLCFFLALLSKEIAVTIPALLLLYEWLLARHVRWRRLFGYAGILAAYLALRLAVLRGFVASNQTGILAQQDVFHRLLTVFKVAGYYLKLLLAPWPLTPDYSDVPLPRSLMDWQVAVPLAATVALLVLAWKWRHTHPAPALAILWFFVALLPISNVVSIGAFAGERFLYLPSVSLALLLAGLLAHVQAPRRRGLLLSGAALATLAFGVMTWQRNYDWKDAPTLWTKVLRHQPENPRANFQLAVVAETAKDDARALELYQKAIHYYPDHNWNPDRKTVAMVKERLSNLCYDQSLRLYKAGQFAAASDRCRQALDFNANHARAWVILGNLHIQNEEYGPAAECYQSALKLDPQQFEAAENLKRLKAFLASPATP